MRGAEARIRGFRPRDLLDLRLALVVIWVYVLLWGEESTFSSKVESCGWDRWENWVFYKATLHMSNHQNISC